MDTVLARVSTVVVESSIGVAVVWLLVLSFMRFSVPSAAGLRRSVYLLPLLLPASLTTIFHIAIPGRPPLLPLFKPFEIILVRFVASLPIVPLAALFIAGTAGAILSAVLVVRQWRAFRCARRAWLQQSGERSLLLDRCKAALAELTGTADVRAMPVLVEQKCVLSISLGRSGYILIPRAFVALLDDAELKALLAHEVAHIARWDGFWCFAATLCRNLMLFNPLAALAFIRFEREQEMAADDLAAGIGGNRLALASCLMKGYRFGARQMNAVGCNLTGGKGILLLRVRRMISSSLAEGQPGAFPRRDLYALAGVAAIALILGL